MLLWWAIQSLDGNERNASKILLGNSLWKQTPERMETKLIFQKIHRGTGPRLCTFILATLNLQVLFYTKAFSIHLAPTTHINNPCSLLSWVPSYCVQIVITLVLVLKIQVFWNMTCHRSARSSLRFKRSQCHHLQSLCTACRVHIPELKPH